MARKAIVDKDIILDLLKKGESTQRIAKRFKVSRQAIDLHRKDFINNGLLPDKRASRTRKETIELVKPSKEINTEIRDEKRTFLIKPPIRESFDTLDEQIELIISAFTALKRLPVLEKELEDIKQENERFRQEIEHLKSRERTRIEQENRWMLINSEDIPDS